MTFQPRPGTQRAAPPPLPPFSFFFAAQLTVLACFLYSLMVNLNALLAGRLFAFTHGLAVVGALACALAMARLRVFDPLPAAFGLRPPHRSAWFAPLLLLPSLLLISELDNWLVLLLPERRPPSAETVPLSFAFVAVGVLLQPLFQELFFRGLLHSRLLRLFSGTQTVIATTLLSWAFATLSVAPLFPGEWQGTLQRSVHSLGAAALLGVLRQSTGSLYPPLLLAALFGVIGVLGSAGVLGIPGFDDLSAAHTPLGYLLPALLLCAAGLRLCQRLSRISLPGAEPEGREHSS